MRPCAAAAQRVAVGSTAYWYGRVSSHVLRGGTARGKPRRPATTSGDLSPLASPSSCCCVDVWLSWWLAVTRLGWRRRSWGAAPAGGARGPVAGGVVCAPPTREYPRWRPAWPPAARQVVVCCTAPSAPPPGVQQRARRGVVARSRCDECVCVYVSMALVVWQRWWQWWVSEVLWLALAATTTTTTVTQARLAAPGEAGGMVARRPHAGIYVCGVSAVACPYPAASIPLDPPILTTPSHLPCPVLCVTRWE